MPNLINTDNAGNTFANYITPVIKGVTGFYWQNNSNWSALFTAHWGAAGDNWAYLSSVSYLGNYNSVFALRFPAPGLETRTGNILTNNTNARCDFNLVGSYNRLGNLFVNQGNGSTRIAHGSATDTGGSATTNISFAVLNDYALVYAAFSDTALTTLVQFMYLGWLREPTYTDSAALRGFVWLTNFNSTDKYERLTAENATGVTTLSTAADSITSPPIVCTAGTDPGDGSETFTDIVIRDAAAPNNPVGKLWNCIDMPVTCNVGELWRNVGAHDGDASASEQDTYLCVMPWGTRKLGMRVWTENV